MTRFLLPYYFDIYEIVKTFLSYGVLKSTWPNRLLLAVLVFASVPARADLTQIAGGLDGRALSKDPVWGAGEEGVRLHGAFLNLRHVISDDSGDRYILVGQVDANDNLEELEAYQVYAQVKGPLGRINLRAGHYILPFGLLANLDTERQLIQTQEAATLGIKLDYGVQLFGFTGPFDYAVSISQGSDDLNDSDNDKLLVARLGLQGEDGRWGVSYLDGDIDTNDDDFLQHGQVDRRRLALDAELDLVPWMLWVELGAGKDDDRSAYGGNLLADFDINPTLSLNAGLAWWEGIDETRELALGLSYRLPSGITLRAADTWQRLNGSSDHTLALQLYWEFSHAL